MSVSITYEMVPLDWILFQKCDTIFSFSSSSFGKIINKEGQNFIFGKKDPIDTTSRPQIGYHNRKEHISKTKVLVIFQQTVVLKQRYIFNFPLFVVTYHIHLCGSGDV